MAEERNQVDLQSDNEDEEGKYGATDRRKQVEVSNQDGGVFNRANNKQAKKKKNPKVTAPQGKFKTFHAKGNPTAFTEMN